MQTVREGLLAGLQDLGYSPERFDEILALWMGNRLSPTLPERYRKLASELVLGLPDDWDRDAVWNIDSSEDESPHSYGSALRIEDEEGDLGQYWEVTLFPALLDRLSDPACRWVIAHELAHVASGIPSGSVVIGGKPYTRIKGTPDRYQEAPSKTVNEDAADEIAMGWGFSGELQAFLADDH